MAQHTKRANRRFRVTSTSRDYSPRLINPNHSKTKGKIMQIGGPPKVFARKTG